MAYNPREKANVVVSKIKETATKKQSAAPVRTVAAKKKETTSNTDIARALAEVKKNEEARKKSRQEASMKLVAARKERRKTPTHTGSNKLQGLASLRNTLGRQYYKKPDSENSLT